MIGIGIIALLIGNDFRTGRCTRRIGGLLALLVQQAASVQIDPHVACLDNVLHLAGLNVSCFILPGIIPPETLALLREECSYFLGYMDGTMDTKGVEVEGINHRGKRYFIGNRYRLSPRMREFTFSPLMAEVAQAALGPNVYLFNEQWVVKNAEQGMQFGWHQDSRYVMRSHPDAKHPPYLTCWVTLDDVSEINGTVHLLPHSRGGTKETIFSHELEPGSNDLIAYRGEDPGDPLIVPVGTIVGFSSYVFHRSGPNTTNRMRRIYLPQYSAAPIGDDDVRSWAMAVPFVKDGKIIYHAADDTAEKYGPKPKKK